MAEFPVIEADPPWHFKTYSEKGDRINQKHYSTMTLDDIKALPVQCIAADNAMLFLWATWPLLPRAIEVGQSWGFQYITCAFDWVKYQIGGSWSMGMGYWTRANSEPCLLFRRGEALPRKDKGVPQLIAPFAVQDLQYEKPLIALKTKHSRKPVEAYRRIEALVDGPYLRLFAREQRDGWISLGNEITGNDIRCDLEALAAA